MALRQLKAENILASGSALGQQTSRPNSVTGDPPVLPDVFFQRAALERCFHRGPRQAARRAAFHRIAADPEAESPSSIPSAKGAAARGPAIQNAAKKPFAKRGAQCGPEKRPPR